ncbi:MAG: APC family permease [Saprospiraceae bacterium]
MAENNAEGLKRVVGIKALATTVVNFTIGAGIFALPGLVGAELRATAILAYIFCSLMLASIMLCYVEVGSKITSSGGTYAYVETAFGPFAGFLINCLQFFGWGLLASAALLNVMADSLAVIFPDLNQPTYRALLFFILMCLIILLNIKSVKLTILFVELITWLKLLPLIGIIIFGCGFIKIENLHWEHLPAAKTFGNTVLVLFFAFAGFETALNNSGEIKNPKRTVPFGLLLGGLIILAIYLLLQTVTQGVLGDDLQNFKEAPLAAVAEKIIGPFGATLLLITAAISCFGAVSGDVFASPRLLFAGAKDGIFPKFLSKIHPTSDTPYAAIITYGTIMFILAISGGFKQLAILASCAILLIYLSVILASIKLRKIPDLENEQTFKIPGGLIVPIIGILSIIWLLSYLSFWEILSTVIFLAIVSIIFLLMKYLKSV